MSSSIATLTLSTRPKIHRPPPARKQQMQLPVSRSVFGAAAVGLLVLAALTLSMARPAVNGGLTMESSSYAVTTPPVEATTMTSAEKSGGTIVIKGERGGIVGQMAKIPTPNVQITEIQAISTVDKASNRELLSIVNKY